MDPSVLVVDAVLGRDSSFRFRRCYTTDRVEHRIGPADGEATRSRVVVLDEDGREIETAPLTKDAGTDPPSGPRRFRFRGTVVLPAEATIVRAIDGDQVLGECVVEATPDIRLEIVEQGERVITLAIDHPSPGPDAWMAVSVFAEQQPGRTVYLGPPLSAVDVDLSDVHAPSTQVAVLYSTGTRSASVAIEPVELQAIEPRLVMGGNASEGPISCWDVADASVGFAAPFRAGHELLARAEWTIDGERVGNGRLVAIGPLDVGRHRLSVDVPAGEWTRPTSANVVVRVVNPVAKLAD